MENFNKLKNKFYRVVAGHRLNLVTLKSSDKTIEDNIVDHRFNQLVPFRWIIVVMGSISSIIDFLNVFVFKTGHPMLVVTAIGVILFIVLMMAFTRKKMKKALSFLLIFYFYVHVLGVSLVYSNVLPDWL